MELRCGTATLHPLPARCTAAVGLALGPWASVAVMRARWWKHWPWLAPQKRARGAGACRGAVDSSGGGLALSAAVALPFRWGKEPVVELPFDYYQVLGAQTHYLADSIQRAHEARVAAPLPAEGFSTDALAARHELLAAARDTLADPRRRGEYNDALLRALDAAGSAGVAGGVARAIRWNQVPGALCLLVEAGDGAAVLAIGSALLRGRGPAALRGTARRDVALSVALAHSAEARARLASNPPDAVAASEALETALRILQDEGGRALAPALQEELEAALERLAPRCVLDLLALPLGAPHEVARREGLQGVRAMLWAPGGAALGPGSPSGLLREQFMREAFMVMTAEEQVALLRATPSSVPAEPLEVYNGGLVLVARGFATRRPALVREADDLLAQLPPSAPPLPPAPLAPRGVQRGGEPPPEVALERAMCALLLGRVGAARAWLGLSGPPPWSPADPGIARFVLAHSPAAAAAAAAANSSAVNGGEDVGDDNDALLPGLCRLLERWLGEVLLPRFRDTANAPSSLAGYFDNASVRAYLEGLDRGSLLDALAHAGAATLGTVHRALSLGRTAWRHGRTAADEDLADSTAYRLRSGVLAAERAADEVLSAGTRSVRRTAASNGGSGTALLEDEEASSAPAAAAMALQPPLPSSLSPSGDTRAAASGEAGSSSNGTVTAAAPELAGRQLATPPRPAALPQLPPGLPLGKRQAQGAMDVLQERLAGNEGVAAVAAALVALLALAMHYRRRATAGGPMAMRQHHGISTTTTTTVGKPAAPREHVLPLDKRRAETVVRRWQAAKADALGPRHNVAALHQVLDGAMLEEWAVKAREVHRRGLHWQYQLDAVRVGSLILSESGRRAMVEAELRESAALVAEGAGGGQRSSYRSTYTSRYELRYFGTSTSSSGSGGWKISSGSVVHEKTE
eukprot:SM000034S12782  [mRNA]  locus=s34:754089:757873:- [translate_table: standard]